MKSRRLIVLLLILTVLGTQGLIARPAVDEADYTLQLLHFADVDGNEEIALQAVEYFSALAAAFHEDPMYGDATLFVSSGDNIIPGPRFYAAENGAVRAVTGSNEPGHADIAMLNAMGVRASAVGNHELDAGPGEFADALSSEEKSGVVFPGSVFPYLSANLDFSTEGDFDGMIAENGGSVDDMTAMVAGSATVRVAGETIGLIGASTPLLDTITTVGGITVNPESGGLVELAAIIQKEADDLNAAGVDKIILLAHMQQISIESELAGLLSDVDIIVAGGSNTRMGDGNDSLYPGDVGFEESYPYRTDSAVNEPILIVNVDGDYKYLGRLVVGFDSKGVILPSTLDEEVNGVWASTEGNRAAVGGTANKDVLAVRDAIRSVIDAQFGNVLGYTDVYLDGRRAMVRTRSTNLGAMSAEANLWYARLLAGDVDVSLKNGGGIRTEIGSAIVPPGSIDYSEAVLSPPRASEVLGTAEGAVTEGHMKGTLRFDNGLVVMKVTAAELLGLLEHGVASTEEGATPGRFPQVAGMKLSFDVSAEPGSRITDLAVLNDNGSVKDVIVRNGRLRGNADRTFRLVTLNFLANGGDGYPYADLSDARRVNLYEGAGYGEEIDYPDGDFSKDPGFNDAFSYTGGEQDAIAEYLGTFHSTPADGFTMTAEEAEMRIDY